MKKRVTDKKVKSEGEREHSRAGGQHEEIEGQKQSAQSRDSLNRSQYKETALLDTTP